jgi:hypothetical protein
MSNRSYLGNQGISQIDSTKAGVTHCRVRIPEVMAILRIGLEGDNQERGRMNAPANRRRQKARNYPTGGISRCFAKRPEAETSRTVRRAP